MTPDGDSPACVDKGFSVLFRCSSSSFVIIVIRVSSRFALEAANIHTPIDTSQTRFRLILFRQRSIQWTFAIFSCLAGPFKMHWSPDVFTGDNLNERLLAIQ